MSFRLIFYVVIQLVLFSFVGCSAHSSLDFFSATSDRNPGDMARAALRLKNSSWQPKPEPKIDPDFLPTPILNEHVEKFVWHYTKRDVAFLRKSLIRRQSHYDAIRKIFSDYKLPGEIINLGIIESGFNTRARSRVGAKGIWQLMRSTARLYGLQVSNKVDERENPIRSSVAAAQHLRDLYGRYQDWNLVLAAYNAGPGSVNRAIARAGTRDYWKLVEGRFLPRETCEFVPRFMAVSLILREPSRYGLELETL